MEENLGIKADYYLFGIELGILSFDQAIIWADEIIERVAEPSGEIVDLALSRLRGRNGVLEALKEIRGDRDTVVSGAMLLGVLHSQLKKGGEPKVICSKALMVVTLCQFSEEAQWEADRLDDEIALAEQGIYGDMNSCLIELDNYLNKYRYTPPI